MTIPLIGQVRLSERTTPYVQPNKQRSVFTLDPVVARLGIDTKQEKPSLLMKGPGYGGDHVTPSRGGQGKAYNYTRMLIYGCRWFEVLRFYVDINKD